jgi:hypothetical protein
MDSFPMVARCSKAQWNGLSYFQQEGIDWLWQHGKSTMGLCARSMPAQWVLWEVAHRTEVAPGDFRFSHLYLISIKEDYD